MDFKAKLEQFLNSMIAKGVSVAKVDAARAFYIANPELIQPTAEGVLAQDELSRQMAQVTTLTNGLRTKETEWNTYLQRANQTLSTAESARLESERRAAAADTAIKAIAQQYNIPEEDVKAIYNPQVSNLHPNPNPNPSDNAAELLRRAAEARANQNQNQNGITREDLVGLINDIGKKDSINRRHFDLTGKPWDSSKALSYITEQGQQGREVGIEDAWRITENIDTIEAAKLVEAKLAERVAIEAEIRAKIASEGPTPLDATPQFQEAKLASIFTATQPNEDGTAKEVVGHHGRTREAVAALGRLQAARRLGQKSPYEVSPS